VALSKIADKVGTPAYVYSLPAFEERYKEIDQAYKSVPHLVAYSMKANGNLSVVSALAKLGSGVDVVSGGELFKARKAGVKADKIIFAGVGKTDDEIAYALKEGIRYFNVESIPEILAINEVASKLGRMAPIAIRFNPDVDPHTHHYITTGKKETKFGVYLGDVDKVMKVVRQCKSVQWTGVHAHIGSQMTQTAPVGRAAKVIEKLVVRLRKEGFPIHTVNLGGGYGIDYQGEKPPKASQYAALVLPVIKRLNATLVLEPGRFISGNSGVLLSRIIYVKQSGTPKPFIFWIPAWANSFVLRFTRLITVSLRPRARKRPCKRWMWWVPFANRAIFSPRAQIATDEAGRFNRGLLRRRLRQCDGQHL
jgi:diaminopimelate decarboxylase